MKFFKSSSVADACADNNSSEDGVISYTTDDDLNNKVHGLLDTTNEMSGDDGYFDKVDFVKLIREGLLYLRENLNVTTYATRTISKLFMDILIVEWKFFVKAIEKSLLRNNSLENVVTLNLENARNLAF